MIQCVFLILATVLLSFAQPSIQAKTYSAERFDQAITVQHDGSLLLTEVTFRYPRRDIILNG